MKKKLFSIILTVTMLVSMLSFFSFSAGAFQEYQYVTPEDFISIPSFTFYYEVILTGFTIGETYDIPLYISRSGPVLVQSFGYGGECAPMMTLLDGEEIICQDVRGFKQKGYRNQTLFQFYGPGSYTLRIKPSGSGDMRISFTFAENYFEIVPPISSFEDIFHMNMGTLFCDWSPGTYAVVGRFIPTETRNYTVVTHGSSAMESYIIDPSSIELFDNCSIVGETTTEVRLNSGTTYYVVMFIPEGPIILDPTSLMLHIF